eukprot:355731-Chlamydomonas_euryale.AAC.9
MRSTRFEKSRAACSKHGPSPPRSSDPPPECFPPLDAPDSAAASAAASAPAAWSGGSADRGESSNIRMTRSWQLASSSVPLRLSDRPLTLAPPGSCRMGPWEGNRQRRRDRRCAGQIYSQGKDLDRAKGIKRRGAVDTQGWRPAAAVEIGS